MNRGNLDAGFSRASKKFEATYRWPFQLHGMMGPSCAVADVQGDKATIWTGTQGPFRTRDAIAKLLAIPKGNVHLLYREGSGSYGRLECDDVAEDAALMSRAVGKPVRVQWMREDEHAWDPKGPSQYTTIRAGVDAQGNLIAWDFMDRSFPWTEAEGNALLASNQIGLQGHKSRIPQRSIRRRTSLHLRKSESRGCVHSLGAGKRMASSHQQSSRPGRFGPRVCQRVFPGRDCFEPRESIPCSFVCVISPVISGPRKFLPRRRKNQAGSTGHRPRPPPANKRPPGEASPLPIGPTP